MTLSSDEFAAFFQEVHGFAPFPWQDRLAQRLAHDGVWPDLLDLPTGSGKTAAIDIAVFHLALEAACDAPRRAPVRIAFIVDRRLVVDDAFERARRLARALREPAGPVSSRVAERLKRLSGDGPPLIARRLRGGIPREDDWARTPAQPTVLCSTVDQVGSRLLFRGYGVSDSMKPVHAGLIGSDCLLLLDEVHLAEPFRQTLRWVQAYNGERWRETEIVAPWRVVSLSATPAQGRNTFDDTVHVPFGLDADDWAHPVLARRLNASKPARLVVPAAVKGTRTVNAGTGDESEIEDADIEGRAAVIVRETRAAFEHFQRANSGVRPAICVVLNRVARARAVFEQVRKEFKHEIDSGVAADPMLMVGPARPLDRDDLTERIEPIRTAARKDDGGRVLHQAVLVIATQCIEAGVDLDFDALVTEAAPVDALRQRFGRLNRAGRAITPYAAVVATKSDLSARYDDPVYGTAVKPAWEYLIGQPDDVVDGVATADFGISAFMRRTTRTPIPSHAVSEKVDAPVLLPAHLDLLSQTSPIPAADPDIALYLHGTTRQPDSITVIWRADLDPAGTQDEGTRTLLMLVPPRQSEAIQLPVWAVRRWLVATGTKPTGPLADVAVSEPVDDDRGKSDDTGRRVFRWKGDDERSAWVDPSEVRPGDTIVAPSCYGGCDTFGWNPQSVEPVPDVARRASAPFAGRRFAVRIAPGLLGSSVADETLADALARAASAHWKDVRMALLDFDLPDDLRADLDSLQNARKGGHGILAYRDLYGRDEQGRPRGVVFYAPFGISSAAQPDEDGETNSSEDDIAGSLAGFSVPLRVHNSDVAEKAVLFGKAVGLPPSRVNNVGVAGRLHDSGKADPRFQAWLHYGDPLGPDPDHLLAKSGRRLPRQAREASGLPDRWRHEALSVRLALAEPALADADDPELILWLIGTHHGYGRPLFPHGDPTEAVPAVGPQSLAFDWQGLDWPMLFEKLKSRYGVWELARLEAVLRLADHRASEDRAAENSK